MPRAGTIALIRQGDLYSHEYVEVISAQIRQYAPDVPIAVLSDGEPRTHEINGSLRGWWAKMWLFAPQFADLRPLLYFDLDTYILGGIEDLLAIDSERLWLINDFNYPMRGNTGVMWVPKDTTAIWEKFQKEMPQNVAKLSDGEFLRHCKHVRFDMQGFSSYKSHQLINSPGNARIVCWHGQPKPHECGGWVADEWNRRRAAVQAQD